MDLGAQVAMIIQLSVLLDSSNPNMVHVDEENKMNKKRIAYIIILLLLLLLYDKKWLCIAHIHAPTLVFKFFFYYE